MASSIWGFVSSIMLGAIFAISIISGFILIGQNNEPDQTLADSPAFSDYVSQLNESVQDYEDVARGIENTTASSPVTVITGGFLFDAIAGIWKSMISIPKTVWNLTMELIYVQLFGSSEFAVVLGIIGALFLVALIIAVIKFISTGDGG